MAARAVAATAAAGMAAAATVAAVRVEEAKEVVETEVEVREHTPYCIERTMVP